MPRGNRLENLQSLRLANLDGAFSTAFATLVTGTFLVGFVKLLGGGDIWIGLLTAVPSLLGILQIPGGIWGRSFSSYKKFVLPGGLIWRLLYVPVIALPILALEGGVRLWLLGLCVCVAAACVLLVSPTYNDWIAEMVPASSRGWFYSRRNSVVTGVGATIGLIGAIVLDWFRGQGREALGFSVVFGLGVFLGLVSFAFFLRMHDLQRETPIKQSLAEGIRDIRRPFSDRNFRLVLIFLVVSIFGQAFPGNLFGAFALESLKLPFTIIQLCGFIHAAGNLTMSRFWGFLADKYGNKPILIMVGFGLALTPVMWLLCVPGRPVTDAAILLSFHFFVGAIWAGVALCQFNILLATAAPEDRSNYLGAALATQAIIGGISPMLGAWMLAALRGHVPIDVAYKLVFGVAMFVRFLAVFLLAPIKEEGALKVRRALQDLSRFSPRGVRAMRELTRSGDVASRESAIDSVAMKNFSLAGDEIIKALHDPSPRVRRSAASALAKLSDPKAVEALLHMLRDHPDLIEDETVEALGTLAHEDAVTPLVELLQSPRSLVRRAAARALGRLGSPKGISALLESAKEESDPDLQRASLQALRILEARDAAPVFAQALLSKAPSVRIAAAEAVSELEIRSAADEARESLDLFEDEAASEVAYALGAIGSDEDVPKILDVASHCVSMITRRRCLLGVARLLGVEQDVYRLLLQEGMSRDTALLELVKGSIKDDDRLRAALRRYASGDEMTALRHIATHKGIPALKYFADYHVDELFLVAACALAAE